jgi:hypothetical protein
MTCQFYFWNVEHKYLFLPSYIEEEVNGGSIKIRWRIFWLGFDNVDKDTELVVPGVDVPGEDLAHDSVPQGQAQPFTLCL